MAPHGWLDIHGHYSLPQSPEAAQETLKALHKLDFMASEPPVWDPETIIQYLDRAGVQMQMLSVVPQDHDKLRAANDYGISVIQKYPTRFGLLASLPTNDAAASLKEIERTSAFSPAPDGFAVSTVYGGVRLSEPHLEPVWKDLNRREAIVFIHPDAYAPPSLGRPTPVIEVAFDTARTATDMLYKGIFRRYPSIKFVLAHCGGALPALSGRIALLGTEPWVPNPEKITREEVENQLARLWVDTAATAKTGLQPAIKMVGVHKCVYGADCGVPCSTEITMEENRMSVGEVERELGREPSIGMNGWALFPKAAERV